MIYFHTLLSISTSLIWIILIPVSLKKFGASNPKPGKFIAELTNDGAE